MKSFDARIADYLIQDGLLTQEQFDEALTAQKKQGGHVLKLLVDRESISEADVMVGMACCLGVPPITLGKMRVPDEVAELIPKDMALSHKMVPVARLGETLYVAMADPLNVLALDDVRRLFPHLKIIPLVSTEKCVTDALGDAETELDNLDDVLKEVESSDVEVAQETGDDIDLDRLVESSQKGPVITLVNTILARAVKDGASDVHFEPFERQLRVRYRIDGVLYDLMPAPKSLAAAISSRIKIMSKLDIAERRQAQDGRFRIKLAGREIDLRVSVVPTVHGEKIVLRLLDKNRLCVNLEALGMDPDDLEKFTQAIEAPHGMILMTGPTGSGKTSTLYAALAQLNTNDVNIVTVEDPVEYQLLGINQIPVKPEFGMTFASGLRAILRQDPDVVMVGEIRDSETADIAVKAALTGHLVLSTLHTNDAPSAITRLVDMGIEPFLVSSSLVMVCAQRLLRRICAHCKEPLAVPADLMAKLSMTEDEAAANTFYRGRGCSRCKFTGFHGRLAILEVLPISQGIREQILRKSSASDLKRLALEEGMKTLRAAGLAKANAGLTSLEEVLRITHGDH